MPFIRDKIIHNLNETEAAHGLIMGEFKNLDDLSREIEENGWNPETESFRDELVKLCDDHHAADMAYHTGLRDLRVRLNQWSDQKHKANP